MERERLKSEGRTGMIDGTHSTWKGVKTGVDRRRETLSLRKEERRMRYMQRQVSLMGTRKGDVWMAWLPLWEKRGVT